MATGRFSRISLVIGLALGAMVLWAGAAPMDASALVGGVYYPTGPGGCCIGAHTGWCTAAASGAGQPAGSLHCNSWSDLIWCEMSASGTGNCELMADIPCYQVGDPALCNSTHSMTCN